jgi:hypothetical protein
MSAGQLTRDMCLHVAVNLLQDKKSEQVTLAYANRCIIIY